MNTPSSWTVARFGDFAHVEHGWPFRSQHYTEASAGKPIVVSIGNFEYTGGFRFNRSNVKGYDGEYPSEFELRPGDLLLVMTCQTEGGEILGVPAQVPDDGRLYLHNQRIGRVVFDRPGEFEPAFAYQLARTRNFNRQLCITASGSKILHTAPQRIEAVTFRRPPLREQRAIAEVLGALDDKIAANARLVQTADQLAAALTREALTGEQALLSDCADIVMGSSPPGSSYNETGEGLVFYQGVRDFGVRRPSNRVWTTAPTRLAMAGDTLVSVRAPVGRTNLAAEETCIGRGLAAARSRDGRAMTLFHILRDAPEAWAPYESEGTVFGSINKRQLESLRIGLVSADRQAGLECQLVAIEGRIASALVESERLAIVRDALLPGLMSGRIRVRDAEEVVGEAV